MQPPNVAVSPARGRVSRPNPSRTVEAPNAAPQARRSSPVPPTLAFLKDAINEVAFANYFLSRYERELRELSPADQERIAAPAGPETPAQRADRLLQIHTNLEKTLRADLDRIAPALDRLKSTGADELEESVFKSRQVLASQVILPNIEVLKLDQDGGVESPFKNLDPDAIIEMLLAEPHRDERAMHQAERVLRNCAVVQSLHREMEALRALLVEEASRQALEDAARALEACGKTWPIPADESRDAGPFSAHARKLGLLHGDLTQRLAVLSRLRPRSAAYVDTDGTVRRKVEAILPALVNDERLFDAAGGEANFRRGALELLFAPGATLGQLAALHGTLPVAQALRDAIAGVTEGPGAESNGHNGTAHVLQSLRVGKATAGISEFIRHHVQREILQDAELRDALIRRAVALCNQGVAADLSELTGRLGTALEPNEHPILTGAEAAARIDSALARLQADFSKPPSNNRERMPSRHPLVALFAELAERVRTGGLVDARELELLIDTALDYVRRRLAFVQQSAARTEYVVRGWSASSRQSRMQKPLGDDIPTAMQLGRIDAELTEAYEALQNDARTFPESDDYPISRALSAMAKLEMEISASIRAASEPLERALTDPTGSPVIAGLLAFAATEWRGEPGADANANGRSESLTLSTVIAEVTRIAAGVSPAVPPVGEFALALMERAGVAPQEWLISASDVPILSLPIARYFASEFGWPVDASSEGSRIE